MIKFLLFVVALFLIVLFGILPASAQDTTGRINEMFLKSIVSIEKSTPYSGTGFLISKYHSTTGMRAFLVTNKHMIGKWSPVEPFAIDPLITVNLYSTIAGLTSVPVRVDLKDRSGNISNKVKVSPDPKIDVAVIELTEYYAANPTLLRYFYDTSYLVPLKQISAVAQLGFGSQVFALGYPSGLKSAKTNQPIAKAGYIASSLSGDLEVNFPWQDASKQIVYTSANGKFFLVDGLIVGGNSGGPVVNPSETKYKVENGQIMYTTTKVPNIIIGIVSFVLPATGISTIYASDHILELIRQF